MVQGEGIYIQCDMEYGSEKDIVCEVEGASLECIEKIISRYSIRVERGKPLRLYIPTSIFNLGKTPGELIKEIFTVSRLC